MIGWSVHRKQTIALTLSLVVVLSLVLNSGVAAASSKFEEVGDSDECPASLVTFGEELWDHVPELPHLNWDLEIPVKAVLLWNSFLVLLDSIFPGIPFIFPELPDLNWMQSILPSSWFDDSSMNAVPVISQVSGTVLGLVPVVGPILDGTAIVTAKDQLTGECLTRMGQGVLLASAGATMVFPFLLPVKGGLKVGKSLARLLPDIPIKRVSNKLWDVIEDVKSNFGGKISRLTRVNEVDEIYRGMLRLVGNGANSSKELAEQMGLQGFTESNYREGLLRLTGRSRDEVQGLEAHHILPQEFRESFESAGIETIHDPRLLVWVDEEAHRLWSKDYSEAWRDFFIKNQNPTVEDILEEAGELSGEYDYKVLFEISNDWLPGWLRLPFQRD